MGLTDTGFYRPTYDEILEDQIERAKVLFGDDIDTSDLSVLGKYIRINVSDIDTLYQTLERVYYARFPNSATGISLDRLCPFAGITRNPASYARQTITITGTAGAEISAGLLVSTESQEVVFSTIEDCTIGENGTVSTTVECEEAGTIGNVAVGTITYIVNPSVDVDSVVNTAIINYGTEAETDVALRIRFKEAVAGAGSNTAESVRSSILRVTGVTSCTITENSTDETVGGIPPYSFTCYVLSDGSHDQEIGEAIFKKKPMGIKAYGSKSIIIKDESGCEHTVAFTPTLEKTIYIKIALTKNEYFEEDGEDKIKKSLVTYLSTFNNGDTVYLSSLYTYINITGVVTVTTLEMSTDNITYKANNISCGSNEVARTDVTKIQITVT